jgi:hypothetical protein
LVILGGEKSQLLQNEILKAARELKNKNFKVFSSALIYLHINERLNELKLIRNDLKKNKTL